MKQDEEELPDRAAELVEIFRESLTLAAESIDAFSEGKLTVDESNQKSNAYTLTAARAVESLVGLGSLNRISSLMEDDNPLVRLSAATAVMEMSPEEARKIFIELIDMDRLDFGKNEYGQDRIDQLAFEVSLEAELRLWELKTGSRDNFHLAPERFWEQQ